MRVELEQRHEHEAPFGDRRVRYLHRGGSIRQAAEEENVDVDHTRAVTHATLLPAQLPLHCLTRVKQLFRSELGVDSEAGVEELALVRDQSHRLGLIHGARGQNLDSVARQRRDRLPQVLEAIPDVGPQAQVSGYEASRQTSTETSPTGSASGGSGFAAFTHTACAP